MQAARGASLTGDPADLARPTPRSPSRAPQLLAVAGAALVVDILTKQLAVQRLTGRPPVQVVGDLLQLTLARNPGAAFSTGTSYTAVISLVAIVAAGVVLWLSRRVRTWLWALALGLLLGGILGNLVDRLFRAPGPLRGHVVDFLELPHWPVFNVADMCINVAAVLILVQALRGVRLDGRRHDAGDR
jgi:signal peptidase II